MPQEKCDKYDFVVSPEEQDLRLDLFLVRRLDGVSRSRIQNAVKNGFCQINGSPCTLCKYPVVAGDSICLEMAPEKTVSKALAEDIPLDVIYEDQDVLVINKAAGMVVHPAAGNWTGTVVNALLNLESGMNDDETLDPLRPGIVHRLDKDTSGILVIAKNASALQSLCEQFAERTVSKTYLAVVHGWPVPQASVIQTFMGRHPIDRKKMTVARDNRHGEREAITAYRVVHQGFWHGQKVAVAEVRLHTGRTHQIRVHMSYAGYPLLGEKIYNRGRAPVVPRQMLHSWKLEFTHPVTGDRMSLEAEIPEDIKTVIREITKEKQ